MTSLGRFRQHILQEAPADRACLHFPPLERLLSQGHFVKGGSYLFKGPFKEKARDALAVLRLFKENNGETWDSLPCLRPFLRAPIFLLKAFV